MQTVTVRRVIHAPINDVFDWLADAENYGRVPTIRRGTLLQPGTHAPNGVGAVREVIAPYTRIRESITHYDRPHEFAYHVSAFIPPLNHDGGTVRLRETPNATEVTWTSTFEVRTPIGGAFLTRLLAPALAAGFRLVLRTADRDLTR